MTRTASCACGQLRAVCEGEPVRVSMCHCLECQKRTGSTYGAQARFLKERVRIEGESQAFSRTGDSGGTAHFRFCPICGSTVLWRSENEPEVILIAVGAFADPNFPAPGRSIYEVRKHAWVSTPAEAEHYE